MRATPGLGSSALPIAGKAPEPFPVTRDQRLLLRPAPALHPTFGGKGFVPGGKFLRPYQHDRAARRRVPAKKSRIMLRHAQFQIVGVAGVIRPVIATQKIGVEGHHPNLPAACILRQAQDERIWRGVSGKRCARPSTGSGRAGLGGCSSPTPLILSLSSRRPAKLRMRADLRPNPPTAKPWPPARRTCPETPARPPCPAPADSS